MLDSLYDDDWGAAAGENSYRATEKISCYLIIAAYSTLAPYALSGRGPSVGPGGGGDGQRCSVVLLIFAAVFSGPYPNPIFVTSANTDLRTA